MKKRLFSLFCFCCLLASGVLSAKTPKPRKKSSIVTMEVQVIDRKLKSSEQKVREARAKAITSMRTFLKKYPNHPKYTAPAMFRLAELLLSHAGDVYSRQLRYYQSQRKKYKKKLIKQEPKYPSMELTKTIHWLTKLYRQYPTYSRVAYVYYLLGYCYGMQSNERKSLSFYLRLTTLQQLKKQHPSKYRSFKIPKSLVAEVWVRIGEHYFRTSKRKQAMHAYAQSLKYPSSALFDKALYKLGWLHYLRDDFQGAIVRFTQLLEYYRNRRMKTGVLRKEAIEYIALSYVDERWGSLKKAMAYIRRVGPSKPYAKELLLRLIKHYGVMGHTSLQSRARNEFLKLYSKSQSTSLPASKPVKR